MMPTVRGVLTLKVLFFSVSKLNMLHGNTLFFPLWANTTHMWTYDSTSKFRAEQVRLVSFGDFFLAVLCDHWDMGHNATKISLSCSARGVHSILCVLLSYLLFP